MVNFKGKKRKFKTYISKANQQSLQTLFYLATYRLGNGVPIPGIDETALSAALNQAGNQDSIAQILSMYSGSTKNVTLFSLGIIPFINASIIVDIATTLIPYLEKLQSEEGELGRKELMYYKKCVSLVLSLFQCLAILNYIKPYIYNPNLVTFFYIGSLIISGSMVVIWISEQIDKKGLGNGTSLIICLNILGAITSEIIPSINSSAPLELSVLSLFAVTICALQRCFYEIRLVSARQASILQNLSNKKRLVKSKSVQLQLKENGLLLKLNQAGIFPLILASNFSPFLTYVIETFIIKNALIGPIIFYCLIVAFNYFYTNIFWDPEKIAEQLRKASVTIVGVTPGNETVKYLRKVVLYTSGTGGVILCFLIIIFNIGRTIFSTGSLFTRINISSLMIVVGVMFELGRSLTVTYRDNN